MYIIIIVQGWLKMYSQELENFIKSRNYVLGGDDLSKVISPLENPQINRITYHPENNSYSISTSDNFFFNFKAMSYEEAKEKKLVKSKSA